MDALPPEPPLDAGVDANSSDSAFEAHWYWLSAAFAVSGILTGILGMPYDRVLFGFALPVALLLTTLGVLKRWLLPGKRRQRFVRWWLGRVEQHGGGYYGVMAVSTFVYLELRGIYDMWASSDTKFFGLFGIQNWADFGGMFARWGMDLAFSAGWPWYWWTHFSPAILWPALGGGLFYFLVSAQARKWEDDLAESDPTIADPMIVDASAAASSDADSAKAGPPQEIPEVAAEGVAAEDVAAE